MRTGRPFQKEHIAGLNVSIWRDLASREPGLHALPSVEHILEERLHAHDNVYDAGGAEPFTERCEITFPKMISANSIG